MRRLGRRGTVLIIVMVIAFVPACSPGSELNGPTPAPNRSPRCVALTSAFNEAKVAWEQLGKPKDGEEWDRMRTTQQRLFVSGCLAS